MRRARKPRSILSSMAASAQRKATSSATRAVYVAMWGEEPKKRGAYNGGRKKKDTH